MRKVERCVQRPLHCAVFPTLGAAHRKGYYDVNVNLDGPGIYDNRVYISVEAVEVLARKEGWISPEEHQEMLEQVAALAKEKTQLEERLEEAERFRDATEYTLTQFGKSVRKKPGPKQKVA